MKQNIYDHPEFFKQYQEIRARKANYNVCIEHPALMKYIPNVNDLSVLDIGCGAGEFAAECAQNGAKHVIGIDISKNMIQLANQKYQLPNLMYQKMSIEEMAFEKNTFDLIVSSLALHYVENISETFNRIAKLLRPNGEFVFSIHHPIFTANMGTDNWVLDENGAERYFAFDRYQEEGLRKEDWLVNGVVMYHRTLSTIINSLIEAGLSIEAIDECKPSDEAIQAIPSSAKLLRSPLFLIIKVRKEG